VKLNCDEPLSNVAFNINVRRYSKVGFHFGGRYLAGVLGFTERAAEIIIMEAKHPHKPWQILMHFFRPAITRAFCRQFVHDPNDVGGEKTVRRFIDWLKQHPRQLLANFFVLRELPALACVRSGVRWYERGPEAGPKIHVRTFTAGRKTLTPVLYACNSTRYGPAVIKEVGTVETDQL